MMFFILINLEIYTEVKKKNTAAIIGHNTTLLPLGHTLLLFNFKQITIKSISFYIVTARQSTTH